MSNLCLVSRVKAVNLMEVKGCITPIPDHVDCIVGVFDDQVADSELLISEPGGILPTIKGQITHESTGSWINCLALPQSASVEESLCTFFNQDALMLRSLGLVHQKMDVLQAGSLRCWPMNALNA